MTSELAASFEARAGSAPTSAPGAESAVASTGSVADEPPAAVREDAAASRLEKILATFRTDRPDFDALHAELDELARAAVLDPDSLGHDAVTGHAIGRFTVPGSDVIAAFDIDTTAKDRSATTGSLRFEWGTRAGLGAGFIARDLALQFRGMTGGRMKGATTVQFHPDTRRKPSDVLGESGEIVVGWLASYEDRGAHLEPLTARAGTEAGSWVIGSRGSVPAIDQPGTPPPPAHDDWYRRIEPFAR